MERHSIPAYFPLLTLPEQEQYLSMQSRLQASPDRNRRGFRVRSFLDDLSEISISAQRGDINDWKRCCVCGVCYLNCGIAVNSRQLGVLTNRCKSSINATFKMLGYVTISARGDTNPELVDALPNLRGKTSELRQWSVRVSPHYIMPKFMSIVSEEAWMNFDPAQDRDDNSDFSSWFRVPGFKGTVMY
jgi:hypothetical protein